MIVELHLLRARVLQLGVWCDRCLLPSAARVELLLRLDDDKPYYREIRMCHSCDPEGEA